MTVNGVPPFPGDDTGEKNWVVARNEAEALELASKRFGQPKEKLHLAQGGMCACVCVCACTYMHNYRDKDTWEVEESIRVSVACALHSKCLLCEENGVELTVDLLHHERTVLCDALSMTQLHHASTT